MCDCPGTNAPSQGSSLPQVGEVWMFSDGRKNKIIMKHDGKLVVQSLSDANLLVFKLLDGKSLTGVKEYDLVKKYVVPKSLEFWVVLTESPTGILGTDCFPSQEVAESFVRTLFYRYKCLAVKKVTITEDEKF